MIKEEFKVELVSLTNWKELKNRLRDKYGITANEYNQFIKEFFNKLEN